MIAVDSSALVAIALEEPDHNVYRRHVLLNRCRVGWPTLVETHLVLTRSASAPRLVREFLREDSFEPVPFDEAMFRTACEAFDRFGKGKGHPARLNFGDCLAYAVAKSLDLPLLFKGDDFRRTDIRAVL